jgi:hypothetical protein
MKPALVILAAVLLLAGCGHAKDPFVGTWRMNSPGENATSQARFVISKKAAQYTVTQGYHGYKAYDPIAVFTRRGGQLVASVRVTNPFTGKPTGEVDQFKLSTSHLPGQLLFTYRLGSPPADTLTMTKLSESTATPTPVP